MKVKAKKTSRIEMRTTANVKERIKDKAKRAGMTVSAYIEYIVNTAA
jgi:predicted DNA binding CopG/RHH family protein